MNGSELLISYRKTGSESAFADLLRHYTNLVYSVAKRRLSDQSLAEDAAQTVFTRLAQTPPKIQTDGELVAWLHRTTLHVAIDMWRSEARRRTREQKAVLMETSSAEETRVWEELVPNLDEALNEISDADRQAVLLRFFEKKPMREVGAALGITEDAAKMRVSRAVNRLRDQLARRGCISTALLLATVLGARSVEAAPTHLIAKLLTIKLAAPAVSGFSSGVFRMLRSKIVWGTSAAFVAATAILLLTNRQTQTDPVEIESVAEQPSEASPENNTTFKPQQVASLARATLPAQTPLRFILRVIDKETGLGVPGAKIHAPYFYAGGVGESHDLETDSDGNAPIPEPDHPEQRAGQNLFITAEGYVPIAMNLHGADTTTNRAVELERALTIGGTVVNEVGEPMPDVELEAEPNHDSDAYKQGGPNTDFQTCKVRTDLYGRWLFQYVPKTYDTITFRLSCSNYAVTLVSVPVGQSASLNATLVIERGFDVVGQVTDSTGQPIAGATIREHHNFGYRKLSTRTDENGFFLMRGLQMPRQRLVDFRDPMHPKAEWKEQEQKIQLIAEAKGMTLQERTVFLTEPTNIVNFALASGTVFRGRVVDEVGNPIPNAAVRTDFDFENQIDDPYKWLTHSDAEGRFEWDSAPNKPVCFWFEADGYEVIRSTRIVPDGTDHEITLKPGTAATRGRRGR